MPDFDFPVGDPVPGYEPVARLDQRPMSGSWVRLVPLSPVHDIDLFLALAGPEDDELWVYRPTDKPTEVAAMGAEIHRRMQDPTFVIVPTEGPLAGRPAGMASYLRIEPAHGSAEVGFVMLARDLQRTRAATEALHLIIARAFDQGYRRFEWKCDSLNEPSRAAARRLGFRFEGRFAHHMVVKGHNRDTDWFSITDAEWPQVREAHQTWLSADNFDSEGVQGVTLTSLTAHIPDSRLA